MHPTHPKNPKNPKNLKNLKNSDDKLVGAEGFEPSNTGFKVPRLTAWPRPIDTCALPADTRLLSCVSTLTVG